MPAAALVARTIQVRGLVQGVGFRPAVWQLAQQHQIRGCVWNDGQGVRIYAVGAPEDVQRFVIGLSEKAPALARVDAVQCELAAMQAVPDAFTIVESGAGPITTGVVPDAAPCCDCAQEVLDPFVRRYRYPFANCAHCGPRLTIQERIPYDRSGTTMSRFPLCAACEAEYRDSQDRRFHAQPIACHVCGPRVQLERADGRPITIDAFSMMDAVDAVCTLLQRGRIVAVKGLGGFQLACDATQEDAVSRLRQLKGREGKPFAVMARDLGVLQRYCDVREQDRVLLQSPAAPIVLLTRRAGVLLAPSVAPGLSTLGGMLPNTPLHHLMLRRMERPIVLTSGNRSDEPQWIDNDLAKINLSGIAEYFLLHDRPIAQRVDDSVVRVMGGQSRVFRRSRGYAPAHIPLPPGFERAPRVLAMGGELKNTFALLYDGRAVLSHHIGDLADARTLEDFRRALRRYADLFDHAPEYIAIDGHPDYLSGKIGRELAAERTVPVETVQHHHAHIAACLVENGVPLDHPPVLGIALDGLGYGDDGQLWGGEFLLADYRTAVRVGTCKPVPLIGGAQAMREPWRNTYAHLMAALGWARFTMNYDALELYHYLAAKPRETLDLMCAKQIHSPLASSCGRLFDAVAGAIGLCRDRVAYEGQAAMELEQLVDQEVLEADGLAYPFAIPLLSASRLPYIEPASMWTALLGDLLLHAPKPVMAARFHRGLAQVIGAMAEKVTYVGEEVPPVRQVALSGGVFQNQVLFEFVTEELERRGFRVLSHGQVPPNDGGIALGQAAVVAARRMVNQ